MSYFKRFTNGCAIFAALSAWLYALIQLMAFTPSNDISLTEKLKLFLKGDTPRDYSMYLTMGLCFAFSFAVSLLFKKLPAISFAVSILPVLATIHQLMAKQLYEYPMMYVVLGALHAIGSLADCMLADKRGARWQSALAAFFSSLMASAVPLYIFRSIGALAARSKEETLNYFEKVIIYSMPKDADTDVFLRVAIFFGVLAILALLLKELPFLTAILSLIPFGYTLYLWHAGLLPVHGALIVTVATVCFLTQIAVMLSAKPNRNELKS